MPNYIIKKQLEGGEFCKVGEISKANMLKDISPPDPDVVAKQVSAAVSTQLKVGGNPSLYFYNQDPSVNNFGYEIVPDKMFELKNWVKEGKYDLYFFNKSAAPAPKEPEAQS